jgi:hypothetical protein
VIDRWTRRNAELGLGFRAYFEPRDIWVGVYWEHEAEYDASRAQGLYQVAWLWTIYVCIVPMLPLRFRWLTHYKAG